MKNEEARRKDFETWVVEEIGRKNWPDFPEYVLERNGNGDYAVTRVQGAWEGWNGALDADSQA